jgi:hypothetical protein
MVNGTKAFAPVKAASAAIAFYQKINLFSHEPTQSPAACFVREAAIRRFGLKPKIRKEPYLRVGASCQICGGLRVPAAGLLPLGSGDHCCGHVRRDVPL